MSGVIYQKPITAEIFHEVIDRLGPPINVDQLLILVRTRQLGQGALLAARYPHTDFYLNRVGGVLRRLGVDPNRGREVFMDTLYRQIYNNHQLFKSAFCYREASELFAVVLLAAGPPKEDAGFQTTPVPQHETDAMTCLRGCRAEDTALNDHQFEAACKIKYIQFVEWCKKGGRFGDVHSDPEAEVAD